MLLYFINASLRRHREKTEPIRVNNYIFRGYSTLIDSRYCVTFAEHIRVRTAVIN